MKKFTRPKVRFPSKKADHKKINTKKHKNYDNCDFSDPSQKYASIDDFKRYQNRILTIVFFLQARTLLSNGHGPNTGNPAYTGCNSISICKNITILFFNINVLVIGVIFILSLSPFIIRINIKKYCFEIRINLQWAMVMGRQKVTLSQIGTLSLFPSMR